MEKDLENRQQCSLITKILFIMVSPKLFLMAIFALANLIGNSNLRYNAKETWFLSFSCGDIIFWRFSFYFETDMKTATFKVILPNFKEKYWPTGFFSANSHCTPTLYITHTKLIFIRSIWNVEIKQNFHLFLIYRTHMLDGRPIIQRKLLGNWEFNGL